MCPLWLMWTVHHKGHFLPGPQVSTLVNIYCMYTDNQSGVFWSAIAQESCWSSTWKSAYFTMDYHQKGLPKFMLWSSTSHNVLMKSIKRGAYYLWFLYFWEMKLMKKESALFKKDYFEYNFFLGGTPTIFLSYGAPKDPRLIMGSL